jgi:hypothetical protein
MIHAGNMSSSVMFKLPPEIENRNYPKYLTEKCEIWGKRDPEEISKARL